MKIGIGLPNQMRGTEPAIIPSWAAQAERAGYSILGKQIADFISGSIAAGPDGVRDTVAAFAGIGATDLICAPTAGDPEEIARLADIVL